MGLNQTAYAVSSDCVEFTDKTRIHEWRKHYTLNDWAFARFQRRHPLQVLSRIFRGLILRQYSDGVFSVDLSSSDIDQLERLVQSGGLAGYQGAGHDLAFIEKARSALRAGQRVVYFAS